MKHHIAPMKKKLKFICFAPFPKVLPYFGRWGLLADRYGLPIRGYWQTVWSANKRLLADRVQNI